MNAEPNHRLRRLATWTSVIVGGIAVVSFCTAWVWPRLVAIVQHADLIEWTARHRAEYPEVMQGYIEFQRETHASFDELQEAIMALAKETAETNRQAYTAMTLSSANQDLLYQLLVIKHKELGLPVPKRPEKPSMENP